MSSPVLYDGSKILTKHTGLGATLQLPPWSTLSDADAERLLEVATWTRPPTSMVAGYEGIRGLNIARVTPCQTDSGQSSALYVSGIGYKQFSVEGESVVLKDDAPLLPPTSENFMRSMPGTKMSTPLIQQGRVIDSKPMYRATGTYTWTELEAKIRNTTDASRLGLKGLIVPQVEAVGLYENEALQNEEGPFGFIAFSLPRSNARRIADEAHDTLRSIFERGERGEGAFRSYLAEMASPLQSLVVGLRELHDRGYVHRQTHLANVSFIDQQIHLSDWATFLSLPRFKPDRRLYRAFDIARPVTDCLDLYAAPFRKRSAELSQYFSQMRRILLESAVATYAGDTSTTIDFRKLHEREASKGKDFIEDPRVIAQWLKLAGIDA